MPDRVVHVQPNEPPEQQVVVEFLLSIVIVFLGTLGYVGLSVVGGGLLAFCAMSVVLGLGYTFYSGAVEAWLVDALRATGFDGQLDRVFARGSMVTGAAMLIGTVAGGLLGSVDLVWPFLLRSGLLLLVFSIAFVSMHDLGFRRRPLSVAALPREMRLVTETSMVYGWQRPSVRLLMMTSFFRLYPDFPKSANTLYLYILRAKLSVRPAQVDGIYVNIISHGSTPARTRACSDTTPRPDALYRALSRLDAVSDQAHVNVTHCQI